MHSGLTAHLYINDKFSGKKVLEVGPRHGNFTEHLIAKGAILTCIEPRKKNIEIIKQSYPLLDIVETDLYSYNPEKKYDIVFAFGVLQHFSNPVKALEKLAELGDTIYIMSHMPDKNSANKGMSYKGVKYNAKTYKEKSHPDNAISRGSIEGKNSLWLDKESFEKAVKRIGFVIKKFEEDTSVIENGCHLFMAILRKESN